MPGATTKYAFPYPLGTDPISDGDDQIKALAERVEAVMAGTGGGPLTRYWTAVRGSTGGWAGGTWTGVVNVPLTAAPVGAVILCLGSVTLSSTVATAQAKARFTSTAMTFAPAGNEVMGSIAGANYWTDLTVFNIGTVTTASPTLNLEGYGNTGTISVDPAAHVIATRLI